MTDDTPITNENVRDLIAEWIYYEFWHSKRRPSDLIHFEYTRALMNLAGADGVLHDEERKWILGSQAAKGTSDEVLNFFRTYQPTKVDLEAMVKEKPLFTQQTRRSLVYEAFLAASADDELHEEERKAIYNMGRTMGLGETVLKHIEQAALNERHHRRHVIALVYPQSLAAACELAENDLQKDSEDYTNITTDDNQ